jgi:hypothetical protein
VCKQRATYRWKALEENYNFSLDLIAIGGLHRKLCALKVIGVPNVRISRLPFGSPGTKSHLDVAPAERRKVYYKGEGGGFPQVQVVVSFVCPNCPWFVLAPKVLQLCTNHFVLVLCRSVWVSEACHFFLVSSWSSSMPPPLPLYSVASQGACPDSLPFVVFNLGTHIWAPQGVGSASKHPSSQIKFIYLFMYKNLSKIPNLNWKVNWIWNNKIIDYLLNDALKRCFITEKYNPIC